MLKVFSSNLVFSLLSTILTRANALVLLYLITQMIGKEDVNYLSFLQANLAIFQLIGSAALTNIIIKHLVKMNATHFYSTPSTFFEFVFLVILIFSSVSILAFIGTIYFAYGKLDIAVVSLSLTIFFVSFNGAIKGFLRAQGRYSVETKANFYSALISIVLSYIFISSYGFYGACVGLFLQSFLEFICYFRKGGLVVFKVYPFSAMSNSYLKLIRTDVFPLLASTLLVLFANWLSLFLIERYDHDNVVEFNIAMQWRNVVLVLPMIISTAALPLLTKSFSFNTQKKESFLLLTVSTILCLLPFVFLLLFFSRNIAISYGEEYLAASEAIKILMLSGVVFALNNIFGNIIFAKGNLWLGFLINSIWLSAFLMFLTFGEVGLMQVCLAYLYSYLLHTFIQFGYAVFIERHKT